MDGDLVVKLDLFAAYGLGEAVQNIGIGVVVRQGIRHCLYQGEVLQQYGKFAQGVVKADGTRRHFLRFGGQGCAVLVDDACQQFVKVLFVNRADHLADIVFGNFART